MTAKDPFSLATFERELREKRALQGTGRNGNIASLADRQARYERLKKRTTAAADGGEGMTLAQAGALETPPISKARVAAILTNPPQPVGRPRAAGDYNLRVRLRYWQRRLDHKNAEARRKAAEQIALINAELAAAEA